MSYTIYFDEKPPRLNLVLTGFWDASVLAAFGAELAVARQSLLDRHASYDVLIDTRGMQIQPLEIIEGFQRLQEVWLGRNSGRVALIVEGALPKMQARRAAVDPRFTLFECPRAAKGWLLAA